jgi:hypothetical protein
MTKERIKDSMVRCLDLVFCFRVHHDFVRLFFKKEGKELLGKKNKNLWVLVGILFVTFVAIGFANGSLDYLGEKMDDPFVNFVNIEIPMTKASNIQQIQYELNNDSLLKQEYFYQGVNGYNMVFLSCLGENSKGKKGTSTGIGRTIEINDPLMKEIIGEDNLISGRGFDSEYDLGLIVTKDFLSKLIYPPDASHAYYSVPAEWGERDTIFPLPIIAVVDELPGLSEFATTQNFKNQAMNSAFNPVYTKSLLLFIKADSALALEFCNAVKKIVVKEEEFEKYEPEFDLLENRETYFDAYTLQISLWNADTEVRKSLMASLEGSKYLKKYNFIQVFKPEQKAMRSVKRYDYITVNFESLDRIRDFRTFLADKYDLQIDMAQIKAMENYNFITKLTRILSLILISFSVLSICLYVSNLLSKHLEKIHMNIGTFKAFGIDDQTLQKTYIVMIYMFISIALMISLLGSWLFGISGAVRGLLSLFGFGLEKDQSYFNLFDYWTLYAVLAILIISFFVLCRSANRILLKSPGDLIYSRI